MTVEKEFSVVKSEMVRRSRTLPLSGEILVEEGEQVGPDDIIAQTEFIPGAPYVVDLKSELGTKDMSIEQAQKALMVEVGQRVAEGEVLARSGGGLFSRRAEITSPVDGVVEYVSVSQGRILIREDAQSADPVVVVNVARQLDVWPAMVRMYMRFNEGAQVEQGQVLAASPGMDSMDYAYAPASGTIERIDAHNGLVYIVRPVQETRLTAYIPGTVEKIIEGEGATIAGPCTVIKGVFGIGGENFGQLLIVGEPGEKLSTDEFGEEISGRVIVVPGFIDEEVLLRAEDLGASGVVTGSIHQLDLRNFLEEEMNASITGEEDVGMTVILTEGFGHLSMSVDLLRVLDEHEGSTVSVNGRTQVRAGAQRPEMLISLDSLPERPDDTQVTVVEGDPEPGQMVRIITKPYFGRFGEVEEVLSISESYETEAELPSVRVRLQDGRLVVVPLANIEMFR